MAEDGSSDGNCPFNFFDRVPPVKDPADVGEKGAADIQSREEKVNANRDLLQLESGDPSVGLERFLICRNGEESPSAQRAKRKEGPVTTTVPESPVLERMKTFLPDMNQANSQLLEDINKEGPEQFNVEMVPEGEERYVELDLALGVFDCCPPETSAAPRLADIGQSLNLGFTGRNNSSSSTSSSDVDDDNVSERRRLSEVESTRRTPIPNSHHEDDSQNKTAQPKRQKIQVLQL